MAVANDLANDKFVKEKESQKLVTILTDTYEETDGLGIAGIAKRDEPCTETKPETAVGIGDHNPITYYHQKDTLPYKALETPEEIAPSRETSQERSETEEASLRYFMNSEETVHDSLPTDIEIEIGYLMLFQEAGTVYSPKEPDCEYNSYTCS